MHNYGVDIHLHLMNTVGVSERQMHKPLPDLSGDFLSPPEVASVIPGASSVSVRRWAESGDLPGAIRLPSGRWQIPWSAVVGILGFDPRVDESVDVAGAVDGVVASGE